MEEAKEEKDEKDKKLPYKSSKLLLDNYEIIKHLEDGVNKKISEIKNKKTGIIFECDKIPRQNIINQEKFEQVIKVLIKSQHPNIIKVYEIYKSKSSIYFVVEKCKGGSMFDRIIKDTENKTTYPEKEAAEILKQVISAVEYYHNNGIYDKYLKPENLLFLNKGKEKGNIIKIIDFGLYKVIAPLNKLKIEEMPNYYISPEAIRGDCTEKCVIWSAGVLLYVLLSGQPPFISHSNPLLYKKILQMKFDFPEDKWKNISNEVKDLINHILIPEEKRYNAKEVLEHPWFQKFNDLP